MGSVFRAGRVDETLWNRHRQTIERLYVKEQRKLEKEDGVIEYMKKHHHFEASKSQYELHFKKWRLRKNLTRQEWRKIIRFMKQRAPCSGQVEALFNGTVLSKERILREIARYGSANETHDGLYEGPCDLPEGVVIRTLSSASNLDMHISNVPHAMQILPPSPQSAFLQLITSHELDFSRTVLKATPPSPRYHLRDFARGMEQHEPFSWVRNVEWDTISQTMPSSQQLTKWKYPPAMQLNAAFYPTQQTLMALPNADESMVLPFYLTASLLNNMTQSGHPTLDDAHRWLKALPRPIVSQFLKALPAPLLDALRERVFAASVKDGDVDTVLVMLALGVDPQEKIMIDWPSQPTPVYPLEGAMDKGHFLVAKAILSHMCRGATLSQLDELFSQLLNWYEKKEYRRPLRDLEIVELLSITLSAGATPVARCIMVVNGNFDLAKQLIESGTATVGTWLRVGLLKERLVRQRYRSEEPLTEKILLYVFHERLQHLPTGDPELKITLLRTLQSAVESHRIWAVETILRAFRTLGYHLDNENNSNDVSGDSIIQACRDADWSLAISLVAAQTSPTNTSAQKPGLPSTWADRKMQQQEQLAELYEAIDRDDIEYVRESLEDSEVCEFFDEDYGDTHSIDHLVSDGRDQMAVMIIQQMTKHSIDGYEGFITLMTHGRTGAVSALLMGDSRWHAALEATNKSGDFGALNNIVYPSSPSAPYVEMYNDHASIDRQQISLRAIAYHASETNDHVLFRWLLDSGMDMDELVHVTDDNDTVFFTKRPAMNAKLGDSLRNLNSDRITWPSLLAIAAGQDNLPWIKFLLDEGADCRDSMALLRAVELEAAATTINMLLEAAEGDKRRSRRVYGSAALREAVRRRDLDMIDLLHKTVDIDMAESSTKDFLNQKQCVSPLGEAILMEDLEMVRVLLEKGASPNACISYDGMKLLRHIKSWLPRASPLLAAIETHNLPMVKMLVESGAEIDYRRNLGMLRTPLERAAEIGNFDIMQYLFDQGALVDTVPVRSGGTALQLAAMNGYVGIATFLLEHGADPNYPPAEGDGRTAFEAASEWGRVDMMSLLMQWGVRLDKRVGDPPQSQYERAVRFAEKNGHMASKRFVQHLYSETPESLRREDAQTLGLLQSPTYGTSPFTCPASLL